MPWSLPHQANKCLNPADPVNPKTQTRQARIPAATVNRPGIPGGFGLPLGLWSRGAGFLHATMVGWWVSNSIGLSMPSEL
jgi:hypothetical protein